MIFDMSFEEAKKIFLNRGFVEVNDGTIFDGDKWRQACIVISDFIKDLSDWTKCSPDNLPDMNTDVLGTTKYDDVVKVTRMKSYYEDAGWEWVLTDDIEGNSYHPDEIIAWMPLPKSYKPQESEGKEEI